MNITDHNHHHENDHRPHRENQRQELDSQSCSCHSVAQPSCSVGAASLASSHPAKVLTTPCVFDRRGGIFGILVFSSFRKVCIFAGGDVYWAGCSNYGNLVGESFQSKDIIGQSIHFEDHTFPA